MKNDHILRIGLLVPSSNTTMEPDLYKMIPRGITVHTARMGLEKVTSNGLKEMSKDAMKASKLLESADDIPLCTLFRLEHIEKCKAV